MTPSSFSMMRTFGKKKSEVQCVLHILRYANVSTTYFFRLDHAFNHQQAQVRQHILVQELAGARGMLAFRLHVAVNQFRSVVFIQRLDEVSPVFQADFKNFAVAHSGDFQKIDMRIDEQFWVGVFLFNDLDVRAEERCQEQGKM
jgi:hypothetical protein